MLRIKIIIDLEFTLETLALIDTGADRNIIRERLILIKYYKKTTQALFTANDQRLKIIYKLPNAIVCINDTCLYLTFILFQDVGIKVILGNLFIIILEPYTIDDVEIHSRFKDKEITFKLEFLTCRALISSLKEKACQKNNHINFLKGEVRNLTLEKRLESIEINIYIYVYIYARAHGETKIIESLHVKSSNIHKGKLILLKKKTCPSSSRSPIQLVLLTDQILLGIYGIQT